MELRENFQRGERQHGSWERIATGDMAGFTGRRNGQLILARVMSYASEWSGELSIDRTRRLQQKNRL